MFDLPIIQFFISCSSVDSLDDDDEPKVDESKDKSCSRWNSESEDLLNISDGVHIFFVSEDGSTSNLKRRVSTSSKVRSLKVSQLKPDKRIVNRRQTSDSSSEISFVQVFKIVIEILIREFRSVI